MENSQTKEKIDWVGVEAYIHSNIKHLPREKMIVKKFSEGYSNLTFLLTIGSWQAVLRRPPFGYTPPKAHNMEREYRILSKVNPVYPLAPKPYLYCEDKQIMDKHFYLMEKKTGVVIDDSIPDSYGSSTTVGESLSEAVIQALIELQNINYKVAGLENFGRPEGYLNRQVNGWIARYKNSKTDEIKHIADIEKYLLDNLPTNTEVTIVHNDFKLNNMMMDDKDPSKVVGVFDWELATIGDPLCDLGSTLSYWASKSDPYMGINVVTNQPGFYSRREFLENYAKKSGRDVSQVQYYLTFGFYKLAVILQQIYYRYKIGELQDERFNHLNHSLINLIELANQAKNGELL